MLIIKLSYTSTGINPEPYRHRYVQTTNATTNEFGAMDDEDVENNFFHHDFGACDGISIECFACKTMNVVRSLAHDRVGFYLYNFA